MVWTDVCILYLQQFRKDYKFNKVSAHGEDDRYIRRLLRIYIFLFMNLKMYRWVQLASEPILSLEPMFKECQNGARGSVLSFLSDGSKANSKEIYSIKIDHGRDNAYFV